MTKKETPVDNRRQRMEDEAEAAPEVPVSAGSTFFMILLAIVILIPAVVLLVNQKWVAGASLSALGIYTLITGAIPRGMQKK
jgi:hypothetical protein